MRRLLAEWEPQRAILLTWPHDSSIWEHHLEAAQGTFCRIIESISRYQDILLVCPSSRHLTAIQKRLHAGGITRQRIHYAICHSNDCWARDHGPLAVDTDTGIQLIDFEFNGWGNQFPHQWDNQINASLHASGHYSPLSMQSCNFVLEGGSIDTDGCGTLLTTSQCLLSPDRNGVLRKQHIEQTLKDTLGVQRLLWLNHGKLLGDDTGGHVDTLARFCNPTTIAYSACNDKDDTHYASLQAMQQELQCLKTVKEHPYQLIPLPIPRAIYSTQGKRLPATYVNFFITNRQVLVPVYQDKNDAVALQRLAGCFPGRTVEPIDALPLIHQGGSIHCITMQLPQVIT